MALARGNGTLSPRPKGRGSCRFVFGFQCVKPYFVYILKFYLPTLCLWLHSLFASPDHFRVFTSDIPLLLFTSLCQGQANVIDVRATLPSALNVMNASSVGKLVQLVTASRLTYITKDKSIQ